MLCLINSYRSYDENAGDCENDMPLKDSTENALPNGDCGIVTWYSTSRATP